MSYSQASNASRQTALQAQPMKGPRKGAGVNGANPTGRGSGRARAIAQAAGPNQPPIRKAKVKRSGLARMLRTISRLTGGVPQKALWAGGSVATLALLAVVPNQGNSKAISQSSCQAIVQSGAEVSRGQISQLLAVPEGSTQAAVRQVVDNPYCTLPNAVSAAGGQPSTVTREAYPLAFDREAWLVVNYQSGEYAGYDFVFKQ